MNAKEHVHGWEVEFRFDQESNTEPAMYASLYFHFPHNQSGTVFGSSLVAPAELPYTVTLFDRATENGSSGH